MQGSVAVHSVLGQGSCFTVVLPLPRCALPDLPAASGAQGPPAKPEPSQALRVLAAEDNAVNQILIKALLEKLGHHCDVVETGREAVRQVQLAPYDLVLMDIQMPDMDGIDATRAIRRMPGAPGQIPILAMTANVMREQQHQYLDAGMNGVVAKPFDVPALAAAIERAVRPASAIEATATPAC